MFVAETKILTNTGWKYISDLSGKDKVLVRNFIGDAEFIQPFALRKTDYDGEIFFLGNKDWGISVTPDHKIVYHDPKKLGNLHPIEARNIVANDGKCLYRKFRYVNEPKKSEQIVVNGHSRSISIEDWYTIIAFTLAGGFIEKRKRPYLYFTAKEEHLTKLTNILDYIGIDWKHCAPKRGNPSIFVKNDSNLVRKVRLFVGARARRDMQMPQKALYGASGALLRHFVDEMVTLCGRPIKDRPGQFSLAFTNDKILQNIETACLLGGYGVGRNPVGKFGSSLRIITNQIKSWNIVKAEKQLYSGPVYSLDLFDGLVYVTEKNYPVWMSPK